jgi:MobA/VirD2-like, nuclease domain/TraI-like middle domain
MLDRMGLGEHQALLIAHNDTGKEHIHMVVNRIGPDGRAWRPYRDMVAAREVVRAVEIEYGLRLTGRDQAPPDLSAGSVREARRTGVQPLADRVREEAGHVFAEATSWRELEAGLARLGYRLERAARGSGLVVTDGSRRASLSHVDRNLSGPKLAARFGETFREHREKNPEPPRVERRAGGREIEPLAGATLRERAEALIDRVSSTRATFTRADIERAAFHEPDSQALARLALNPLDHGDMAKVGKDARGVTRYAATDYLRDKARRASSVLRARPGPGHPHDAGHEGRPGPQAVVHVRPAQRRHVPRRPERLQAG